MSYGAFSFSHNMKQFNELSERYENVLCANGSDRKAKEKQVYFYL